MDETDNRAVLAAIENLSERMERRFAEQRLEMTEQISGLRQEMTEQISGVRQEMAEQISGVRQEMAEQISGVRQEMAEQISGVRQEMASKFAEQHQRSTEQISELREEMLTKFSEQHDVITMKFSEQLENINQQIGRLREIISGVRGGFDQMGKRISDLGHRVTEQSALQDRRLADQSGQFAAQLTLLGQRIDDLRAHLPTTVAYAPPTRERVTSG